MIGCIYVFEFLCIEDGLFRFMIPIQSPTGTISIYAVFILFLKWSLLLRKHVDTQWSSVFSLTRNELLLSLTPYLSWTNGCILSIAVQKAFLHVSDKIDAFLCLHSHLDDITIYPPSFLSSFRFCWNFIWVWILNDMSFTIRITLTYCVFSIDATHDFLSTLFRLP